MVKELEFIREKYINKAIPDLLYHYTSINALHSIIANKRLWVSNIKVLNDTTEINRFSTLFKTRLTRSISEESRNNHIIDNLLRSYESILSQLEDNIFVLSLSGKRDSINMWNQYGVNDGYAISFLGDMLMTNFIKQHPKVDLDMEIDTKNKISTIEGKVIYVNEATESIVDDYVDLFIRASSLFLDDKIEEDEFSDIYIEVLMDLINYSCFIKDASFLGEDEYRILFILPPGEDNTEIRRNYIKFRTAHGILMPYLSVEINEKIMESISEITIGPKINIDIAEYGIAQFLLKLKLEHINICRSSLPLRY